MSADEIGVQMRLDHMLDPQSMLDRVFDVDPGVTLRVHHRRHTSATDQIRGVRQTTQIELLKVHDSPRRSILRGSSRAVKSYRPMGYHAVWPNNSPPSRQAP